MRVARFDFSMGTADCSPMPKSLAERLARVASTSTLQLTHYGRKSGKPYAVTIWFMVDGDIIYLATASMDRQWTRNVRVRPTVELRVDGQTFEGTVKVITDAKQRKHVTELVKQKYWYVRPLLWLIEKLGLPDRSGAFRVKLRAD